jgi:probable F420-dependent oxidoreductase
MTRAHPFRFGVICEHMTSAEAWRATAQQAERLGYATLFIRDHFIPEPFGDQFAPLIALMAAADATTTLRVGSLVLDNDYRHPVMLAKEAATLDVLSGGRFELGLGAGWAKAEYQQAGMSFDAPGLRVSRLEEALRVIKGLFASEPLTFSGTSYRIDQISGYPGPIQRPHPPTHPRRRERKAHAGAGGARSRHHRSPERRLLDRLRDR